jgi:diguanylate cyclase (GGDEF)-like protein
VSIEVSLSDITMRRRLQRRDRRREEPEYEVAHGTITGLVNRAGFERRLERAVQSARRGGGPHALCYLDLDRFKLVNELDGHSAGDAVLRQVGRHLSEGLRTRDTVARVGGDEFVLLLEHCSPERSREVAAKVVRAFQDARFNWKEWDLVIGASIGIAPLTTESESAAAVLREADAACHAAKRRGGNCVHVAGDAELTALSADRTRGRGPLTRGRAASVGSPVP